MKKFAWIAILLSLAMLLTGCGKKEEVVADVTPAPTVDPHMMTIRPAEFSEETQQILDILENEVVFFDYSVDESIKSVSVELWTNEGDGWTSLGRSLGDVEPGAGRIGVKLSGKNYELYTMGESGHSKTSYDGLSGLESMPSILGSRLSESMDITADTEIELWMRIGVSSSASFSTFSNFRSASCDAGVAATITFSSKTAEEIIAEEAAAAEAAALAETEAAQADSTEAGDAETTADGETADAAETQTEEGQTAEGQVEEGQVEESQAEEDHADETTAE